MRTQLSIVRAGSACPLFAKLAALVLAITFTFGCSSGGGSGGGGFGNDSSGSTSSPSGGGGGIVNAPNEAWMHNKNSIGLIFKQNGEVTCLDDLDNDWYLDKTPPGTYSISGDQITYNKVKCLNNGTRQYSISGNTLKIWKDDEAQAIIFTRTGGLNIKDGSDYVEKGNNIANYKPPVQIGDQLWMSENLDYKVAGSKCYYDNDSYCTKLGRLYTWATAMDIDTKYNNERWGNSNANHQGLCPTGWHIPSKEDFDKLLDYVKNSKGCGSSCLDYLKSTSDGGKGSFDFSARTGGKVDDEGNFRYIGDEGYWWFQDENAYSFGKAEYWELDTTFSYSDDGDKNNYYSIRCLQNN